MEIKNNYQLGLNYNIEAILNNIQCYKNNPRYDEYKTTLKELIESSLINIQPKGYIIQESRDRHLPLSSLYTIYCLVSLGPWIDGRIKESFESFEYLEGMMLSSLADQVLYEATNELYQILRDDIKTKGKYLTIRYEPGNSNIPMTMQKEIYDLMTAGFDVNLSITEGYMLSPLKSLVYFYGVEDEECSFGIDHDCSKCGHETCKHRKYIITVYYKNHVKLLQAQKDDNLLNVLRKNKIYIESPCSGKGICGKCKVKVPNHEYAIKAEEAAFLTKSEMKDDIILACFHKVDKNIEIKLDDLISKEEITFEYAPLLIKSPRYSESNNVEIKLGIGIDIGTTTVVVSLINKMSQEVLGVEKLTNPQSVYGAYVISRIQYVAENPKHPLGDLIREALQNSICSLIKNSGHDFELLEDLVISGNTTMIYLLLGINPEKLAVSPFTTVDLGVHRCSSDKLWSLPISYDITILPWISAYVGGDIVSGLYAMDLREKNENVLFIDIGTNGEIALYNGDSLLCASTAAGPAFEGVNIRCGMSSVEGAICAIEFNNGDYDLKVVGNIKPTGICGSGLIDAVSILFTNGIIKDTGYMDAPYMFYDEVGIYPADVRQVQLAKSAIKSGITVLLQESGLTYESIDYLYIAGGFGSHLNVRNAVTIGLIPKELEHKVVAVGNTSLAGSVKYLLEKNGQEAIEDIINRSSYIELSTSLKFNEEYIENMIFGGE